MELPYAEDYSRHSADRVRRSTAHVINRRIDRQTDNNTNHYSRQSSADIRYRISKLDQEWDIERVLEVNASSLALSGLVLGLSLDRRWFAVPAIVLPFLLQHGLQGWCPPLPILRRLCMRIRGEIDREKYALTDVLERRHALLDANKRETEEESAELIVAQS